MGANERLGLPRQDGMEKFILCVDVDGTLINNVEAGKGNRVHGTPYNDDVPHVPIINAVMVLSTFKNIKLVVWSGGGKQYAETWGRRLGLDKYVWRYASKLEHEDIKKHGRIIAIDDIQDTAIGDINLIVRNK